MAREPWRKPKVLSIDSESGVCGAERRQNGRDASRDARTGDPGSANHGEAVVTDVRKEVCGALVQKLAAPAEPVRVGDSASVKTND